MAPCVNADCRMVYTANLLVVIVLGNMCVLQVNIIWSAERTGVLN